MDQNIPDHLISNLSDFVRSQTGLYFPKEKWRDLNRGVKAAVRELTDEHTIGEDTESCIQWLLSSPPTKKQLDTLVGHLTIGETFFFRDKNIFQVLKDHILSGWIKSSPGRETSIRFWSAGCCTGEESYSIAMLVDQMMPELKDWKTTILATDINTRFLRKAEKGAYTRWSFRDTPDGIVEKYFKKRANNRYDISPHLKEMVNFCQLNLAEQDYPSALKNTHAMDVIFCRNVLMYFAPDLRGEVIKRLTHSLVEGGWLIVSPSETAFVQQPDLNAVRFPGAVLHRKGPPRKEDPEQRFSKTRPRLFPFPAVSPLNRRPPGDKETKHKRLRRKTDKKREKRYVKPKQDIYQESVNLYKKGRYEESVEKLTALLSNRKNGHGTFLLNPESMALLAKSLANLGQLDEAKNWTEKAVHTEKLNPGHHYLLATINQEQGRLTESISSLKHALYLDPGFVLAHFVLGNLTRQQGKINESRKHYKNVLSLLLSMDHEEILPYSEGMTAGRLMETVRLTVEN